jgi:DNA-binding NtrC family response regulator
MAQNAQSQTACLKNEKGNTDTMSRLSTAALNDILAYTIKRIQQEHRPWQKPPTNLYADLTNVAVAAAIIFAAQHHRGVMLRVAETLGLNRNVTLPYARQLGLDVNAYAKALLHGHTLPFRPEWPESRVQCVRKAQQPQTQHHPDVLSE